MGKRTRRTKADIDELKAKLYVVVEEDRPMTVRQVFYRMVSIGAIAKSENEYKNVVCRLLVDMRRSGELPYGWISDNTRWMRRPRTYSSMKNALMATARTYRRSLWDASDTYVEIWLEKDALAGVLSDVTYEWDVPLMVTRGYPSITYLHEAAEAIASEDRPAFLYYFGDYDPSGVDIPRFVDESLRELAPHAEIHFERVAVSPEQIEEYGLITRPTKRSDSRSRTFKGESVEVDAIRPRDLRELTRSCIERHNSPREYEMLLTIEAQERETLEHIANSLAA